MAEGNGDAVDLELDEDALARERELTSADFTAAHLAGIDSYFAAGARWGARIRRAALLLLVFSAPTALLGPMVAHLLWRIALASWGWGG